MHIHIIYIYIYIYIYISELCPLKTATAENSWELLYCFY